MKNKVNRKPMKKKLDSTSKPINGQKKSEYMSLWAFGQNLGQFFLMNTLHPETLKVSKVLL